MKPHNFLLLAAAATVVAERAEPTAHFILLATQRTGSTWVMSELSKHSSCIATLEAPERDGPELERRREDADRDGVRAVLARRCVS